MASESWVVAGPQIIEIEAITSLRVQLAGGRVDVVAHDGPGARIEVHAVDGRPLEVSLSGDGELRVGYQFTLGGWDGFLEKFRNFSGKDRADVHLAVPRRGAGQGGHGVAPTACWPGSSEDASVSTVSGTLITDGTRGRLGANTVSGEIVVRDHRGDLKLNSVSGELAASGELSLVQANSVSGSLTFDVTSGTSSVTATTVSGDVTVRLPAGQGRPGQGRSRCPAASSSTARSTRASTPGHRKVDLRTGDGACFVSASTVSGHLTVLRGAGDAGSR